MTQFLYFDNASTTPCCDSALEMLRRYSSDDFGNPSSAHLYGQTAAKAIREARAFFAQTFRVEPEQVIFTGSGTEANNLAIQGVGASLIFSTQAEHPSVKKTIEARGETGATLAWLPLLSNGQVDPDALKTQLIASQNSAQNSNAPQLVSIQRVNQITGTVQDVEHLAQISKSLAPSLIFHTDAVQGFGKIRTPKYPSAVDLVSISSHKIEGPKSVGALILLNRKVKLRPILWGGEQEMGLRPGTQNAGLIAGFHKAAERALTSQDESFRHYTNLREHLRREIESHELPVRWNSVADVESVPYIVSLSVPGLPAGALARLLEERGCLVSVGTACSSKKSEPDPVLAAMGLPYEVQTSSIRISFSRRNHPEDITVLGHALKDSIDHMERLLGKSLRKKQPRKEFAK